ncbi:hypothetical protein ASZ90_019157 [hydrocarbon metagenome]|uniref:Nitroreductase domain-containing protein n=1 Tax=hydrocarbon metagenome TaxID=938273 RepID=A0A0W8E4G7_9ZZZZ
MDILSAIKSRRSIRSYLPNPVPQEVINEILEVSLRAPSAVNNQPWEFTVVTGETLAKIKQDNVESFLTGAPTSDRSLYKGIYKQRQAELAMDIFALMEIKRDERDKRLEWSKRGFRFFDAPTAIIISADKTLRGSWAMFDIGAVAQTICLAAMNYGVATCIEDQGTAYHEVIREHTGIPESKEIIIGIALGYPDSDFPANTLITRRESLDNITTWLGY